MKIKNTTESRNYLLKKMNSEEEEEELLRSVISVKICPQHLTMDTNFH